MNKTFNFKVFGNIISYFFYLIKWKLSCKNYPCCTKWMPECCTLVVCVVCLCAYMNIKIWRYFTCYFKHTGVGYDYCISTHLVNLFDKFGKFFYVFVVRYDVCCYINFFAHIVSKFYSFFNFFFCKVFCSNSKRKFLATDVNCIGTVNECIF